MFRWLSATYRLPKALSERKGGKRWAAHYIGITGVYGLWQCIPTRRDLSVTDRPAAFYEYSLR